MVYPSYIYNYASSTKNIKVDLIFFILGNKDWIFQKAPKETVIKISLYLLLVNNANSYNNHIHPQTVISNKVAHTIITLNSRYHRSVFINSC